MLLFKARFLDLIRAGRKTQTIRLWRHPRVKPGQLAYVPGLDRRLRILTVRRLPSLATLTRADARADGFPSRRALLSEIRRLYPHPADRKIWRVRFAYSPPPITTPRRAESKIINQKSKIKNPRRALARFILALRPPAALAGSRRP